MNQTLAAELDKYQTWTLSQLEEFLHKAVNFLHFLLLTFPEEENSGFQLD